MNRYRNTGANYHNNKKDTILSKIGTAKKLSLLSFMNFTILDNYALHRPEIKEAEWNSGYHTTQRGENLLLKHMTDTHLNNTINYFKSTCNITKLVQERIRRLSSTKVAKDSYNIECLKKCNK